MSFTPKYTGAEMESRLDGFVDGIIIGQDVVSYSAQNSTTGLTMTSSLPYIKFLEAKPVDYAMPMVLHMQIKVKSTSNYLGGCYDTLLTFVPNNSGQFVYNAYATNNSFFSTSYRPLYNLTYRNLTAAGVTNEKSIPVGIYYDGNMHENARIFEVYILNSINAEVTLNASATPIGSADFIGDGETSDYLGVANTSIFGAIGFKRTGEENTYDRVVDSSTVKIADSALYRYKLVMQLADGTFAPLSTNNKTSAAGTATPNTSSKFLLGGKIMYYMSTSTVSSGGTSSSLYPEVTFDARYALSANSSSVLLVQNTALTSSNYDSNIYLKMVDNGDGTLSLDSSLSTTDMSMHLSTSLPASEDGYVYILLGRMVHSTSSMRLFSEHPYYKYENSKVVKF